ncbi:hypothetical protein BJ322DRAFT_1096537 [Thelephora terrestris]|uniref:Uncharacterized protein n=1 Tax=Thelephora terrestris TaxID=56493 RepID=A0A9P6L0W2_9AGAM|nr:hypothetical protein BJ322DRAFT_1096537 [Thelephora terrestris]
MKLGGCEKGKKKTTWEKIDEFGRKTSKDGRNTFCYIASQPGKKFMIGYSRKLDYGPPNTELAADVLFGGVYDGGWLTMDPTPGSKKAVGEAWYSVKGDKKYECGFRCQTLLSHYIDGGTPDSVDPESVGRLTFRVREIANLGQSKVNEKDKKPGRTVQAPGCAGACTFGVATSELSDVHILLSFKGLVGSERNNQTRPKEPKECPQTPTIPPPFAETEPTDDGKRKATDVPEVSPLPDVIASRPARKTPKLLESPAFASGSKTHEPKSGVGFVDFKALKWTGSPLPKVKIERESTRLVMTPEVVGPHS